MVQLQSAAGNAAVVGLLAGRRGESEQPAGVERHVVQRLDAGPGNCPPPPVAPPGITPAQDPKFKALKTDVAGKAKTAKAHPPPSAEVKKAQDAAVAPPDDKEAQAKEAQAEKMAGAKPGGFDKAKFIAAVTKAIEAQRPKTNEEAKDFAGSGKAGQIKSQVAGMVTQGKQDSAKDIADKTEQAPDPGVAKDKPVTPLPPPGPAPQLAPPDPKKAVPDKAPAEQTELGSTKCELNSKMADADVTEEQLAKSNEPEFTAAVDAKKGAEQHAATAPQAARADEAAALAAATGQADAAGKAGIAGLVGARTSSMGQAQAAKTGTKSKDEQERARISGEIRKIFDGTKTEVNTILGELDGKVAAKFEAGERDARALFEADHKKRMADYEDSIGYTEWFINKFRPTRPEVLQIFVDAAGTYEKQMRVVISDVADLIGSELDRAKARIAKGRADVAKFVAEQPKALQGIAKEAAQQIGGEFDNLDSSVDAKQDALVDDLAAKYAAAREDVDKRVKELQEENKSWRDKAVDAVAGAIETILKLKDMLLGVLSRAANAVTKIIKDPIGFLGNFISAVKTGVMNFGANILEHLKKGLQGWLFGALADAGIEIPDKFDLKGIVKLILSLLGLTWNAIRARIVKVIPEPVMKVLETSVDFIQAILSEGVVGLWKWIVAKMSDLKEMVMSQIKDFVVTKIITAGITWLVSLLNPAAAFIKACKMIYDAVMWFVDNADRLKDFVNSILDSVKSIASGGAGAVAGYIEKTLAKTLPMVISGLASLLGLGGISDKIKKVLETVQKPVMSIVDKLVGGAVKYGKKLMGKLRGKKKEEDPAAKQKRLDDGLNAAVGAVNRFSGRPLGPVLLRPILIAIKLRHRLTQLTATNRDGRWHLAAVVNPGAEKDAAALVDLKGLPNPEELVGWIGQATAAFGRAKAIHESTHRSREEAVVAVSADNLSASYETQGGGDLRQAERGRPGRDDPAEADATRRYLETDAALRQELSDLHRPLIGPAIAAGERGEVPQYPLTQGKLGEQQQRALFEKSGRYLPLPSPNDQRPRGKGTGMTSLTHAEKQLSRRSGSKIFGISTKPMCADCQVFFRAKAMSGKVTYVAVDVGGVHIFLPDGSVRSSVEEVRAEAVKVQVTA